MTQQEMQREREQEMQRERERQEHEMGEVWLGERFRPTLV